MNDYLTSGEVSEALQLDRRALSRIYCEHKNEVDVFKDTSGRLHFNLKSLLEYLRTPEGQKTKRLHDFSEIDSEVGKPYYILTGYGHLISVDDDGNIYNLSTHKRLKPSINEEGYSRVAVLQKNGKCKNVLVHQLVAQTLPNSLHKSDAHHINGNKSDNRRENVLPVWRGEHGQLHQIMNAEQNDEYSAMVAKIREDNAQPVYKIPCEYASDDGVHDFYFEITQEGYDMYQKTGDFPASTIIRQFFEYKKG